MQLPPVSVIASWPTPNHVNPESRGNVGLVVGLLLSILVTITLAIRLYARKWLTKGFGFDDVFILLAYIPTAAFTILGVVAEERLQWNRHTWDIEPRFFTPGLKLAFTNQILFEMATSLIKLSILTLLYRLTTASRDQKMTAAVLVSIVFISLNCFVFIIVGIFQCTPLSEFWELSIRPQNCINQQAYLTSASVINTITDFLVVLLPIKTALSFNLPARQIMMIASLFGVGILASSVGIARSYFTCMLTTDSDTVWNSWIAWFCSAIELNLGIICASIPATRPFFASHLPNVFETTFKTWSCMTVDWDKRPLTQSPSMTTFIDQSSTSSTMLPQHPPPILSPTQTANLNKPLPPIMYERPAELKVRPGPPSGFGLPPRSLTDPSSQRVATSARNQYKGRAPSDPQPRDLATIVIMYRGDNDSRSTQRIPSRTSLV
ncbi:hypothetical protein M426DRAFT_9219 [Hypoxylon sp. CI-4A]|nr:hypothetical protein M426DRAFT_9219 [Hypoxylon sp. CI-4A]